MSFASLFPVFMFELGFHSILQWPVTQHKHRSSNSEHFISDLGNSVTYFTTKYITSWIFFTYIICLVKKFVYKVLSICYMPRETESSQKRHPLFHTAQLVCIFCIETETHYAPKAGLELVMYPKLALSSPASASWGPGLQLCIMISFQFFFHFL